MTRIRSMRLALLLIVAASAASADELEGLWKAKRWFGPFARGPLVIQQTGATYTADIMGWRLPVRVDNGELSFALPNGQGSFRGKLQADGVILGQWNPPSSVHQIFQYASPVQLKPDGPQRWSGQVVPFEDVFTFYLLARKRPDGSLATAIR